MESYTKEPQNFNGINFLPKNMTVIGNRSKKDDQAALKVLPLLVFTKNTAIGCVSKPFEHIPLWCVFHALHYIWLQ